MAPVRERVDQITHSPVFVDESGRRRAWVMWVLGMAGVLCLGYVLLLGFSFAGGPIKPGDLLPVPGLKQARQRSTSPTPLSPTVGGTATAPAGTSGVPPGTPSGAAPAGSGATVATPRPTGAAAGGGSGPSPSGSPQAGSRGSISSTDTSAGPAPTTSTAQASQPATSPTSAPAPTSIATPSPSISLPVPLGAAASPSPSAPTSAADGLSVPAESRAPSAGA